MHTTTQNHQDAPKTPGPLAASLVTTLHERNRVLFGIGEVKAITGLGDASARSFVRSLVDRGVVTRLKPGLFILVPFELGKETEYMGHPWLVAKALAGGDDYYLSHVTAMEAHQMITQPQLVVYVSSPNPKRTRSIMGTEFRFVRCRKKHILGIEEQWATKQEKVRVSEARVFARALRAWNRQDSKDADESPHEYIRSSGSGLAQPGKTSPPLASSSECRAGRNLIGCKGLMP